MITHLPNDNDPLESPAQGISRNYSGFIGSFPHSFLLFRFQNIMHFCAMCTGTPRVAKSRVWPTARGRLRAWYPAQLQLSSVRHPLLHPSSGTLPGPHGAIYRLYTHGEASYELPTTESYGKAVIGLLFTEPHDKSLHKLLWTPLDRCNSPPPIPRPATPGTFWPSRPLAFWPCPCRISSVDNPIGGTLLLQRTLIYNVCTAP